ncbi:MAG TPA: hypothetical protein VM509_05465, partial [Planctomycetota bacterium]|nr:hypothetical protein [Planctomycetota bacterium]
MARREKPVFGGFGLADGLRKSMKPFHWTLLAVCVASCRATDRAVDPPRGRESPVVVPEPPAQPAEPSPPAAVTPTKIKVADPPPAEPRARVPGELELFAMALRDALALATARRQAEASPPKPEPSLPSAESIVPPAPEPAPNDPASLLNDKPALVAAQAKAAAEGRWTDASELASRIAALDPLEKARLLGLEGKTSDAVALLEREVASAPNRPELLEALAEIELKLADQGRRDLYEKARDEFRRAGASPTALLGLSRTERALGDSERALDCARQALMLLAPSPGRRLELDPAPEIVLADAGLDVHRKVRLVPGPAAAELFAEIEAALQWRIGRVGTDAAAHARLANLYFDVQRFAEAESAAMRGLISSPSDAPLASLLANSAYRGGGSNRLLEVFSDFRKSFPHQPLGYWHAALEYFRCSANHQTLDEFKARNASQETQLENAERYFRVASEQDQRFTRACQQYQALCRALQGWELFKAKRHEEARARFVSMDKVLPGSVALDPASVDPTWAGKIESGATGLARIAALDRDAGDFVGCATV